MLAVGVVAVSISCVVAVAAVGHATAARVALDGAADAAALAGADAIAGFVSDRPCRVAERTAGLHSARLGACTVSGMNVHVTVVTTILGFTVSSRARAGPRKEF